jgi:hypothetical protein
LQNSAEYRRIRGKSYTEIRKNPVLHRNYCNTETVAILCSLFAVNENMETSMRTWKHGYMETWRRENMQPWEHGDMEIGKHGDMET